MRPSLRSRAEHGFTLIELMVTLAILAIIVTMAAPSFRQLLEAQRLRATALDVVADLVLARSEALKRSADVTLKPNASGWTSGWTVEIGTEKIATRNRTGGGVAFTKTPDSVTFNGSGRVTSTDVVRFGIETSDQSRQRCISIDPSGRPKSSMVACPK